MSADAFRNLLWFFSGIYINEEALYLRHLEAFKKANPDLDHADMVNLLAIMCRLEEDCND